ncbi:hypothetical protein IX39_08415 [Chryseobacterium formosense]|uniref:Uncharacterized protein n=1 Tax=Chryseobacterium formosense TaxID=236814 RepID=A0A085Z877_9FLAO|nr:hypothetical protein IX39_08415 [Chryseobacterium formosense]
MQRDLVFYTSILMAFSAGFVDASTFTTADGLFSAHVTGEFCRVCLQTGKSPYTQRFYQSAEFSGIYSGGFANWQDE